MLRFDPSTSLLLRRGIRRGYQLFRREHSWWSTLGALLGVLLLIQLLLVAALGAGGVERLLRQRAAVRVEILATAKEEDVHTLFVALRGQSFVSDVTLVTQEQAYERERSREPDLIAFLEKYNLKNPFPDTLAVTLRSLADYDVFKTFVRGEAWASIVNPEFLSRTSDQEREVQEMLRLTEIGRSLVYLVLSLLLFILLFVLVELVRRRALARKEEVLIERIVGAQEVSILLPFATEGALLLLVSITISLVLVLIAAILLPIVFPSLLSGAIGALWAELGSSVSVRIPLLLLGEAIVAPLIALAGAWLALRSFRTLVVR